MPQHALDAEEIVSRKLSFGGCPYANGRGCEPSMAHAQLLHEAMESALELAPGCCQQRRLRREVVVSRLEEKRCITSRNF